MVSITIVLPDKALKDLKERAESEGKPLEELISESIFKALGIRNPQTKAELHLKLCEKYMREAEELLAKGDHIQASEKAWGAASQMVKALAAQEGKEIKSHRELHEYLAGVVERTKDVELRRAWSAAGELHRNFYKAWLPQELVKGYVEDVREFVDKLRKLLQ